MSKRAQAGHQEQAAPRVADVYRIESAAGRDMSKRTVPTLEEIRGWPATVSVPQAAPALGCSPTQLYTLIRRGECPVKTLSYGRRHVVITADLIRVLSGEGPGSA